jgi:hypothetical protein
MRAVVVAVLLVGCRAQPAMEAKPATVQPPVIEPRTTGELCRADGFDFAYYDRDLDEEGVVLLCGTGPGTPCEGGQRHCEEHHVILCERGKLTRVDCREHCRRGGYAMHLYDDGTCGEVDGVADCRCCGAGEPGCPSESPQPRRVVPLSPMPT